MIYPLIHDEGDIFYDYGDLIPWGFAFLFNATANDNECFNVCTKVKGSGIK